MNQLSLILQLMRLNRPTGYLLLFFPCAFGTVLAANSTLELYYYLPLFLLGSILMRGAGCIINDFFDRNIDQKVERTKNRPLATRKLRLWPALTALMFILFMSLGILFTLSRLAIYLGLFTSILVVVYPLLKRITYWPQAWLGLTFNIGVLISAASVRNFITWDDILLYIGCIAWTIGYDTIYSFMDYRDDLKIRVKSLGLLLLNTKYKVILQLFYFLFMASLLGVLVSTEANIIIGTPLLLIVTYLLHWQVHTLEIDVPANCLTRFKLNSLIGMVVVVILIITKFPLM